MLEAIEHYVVVIYSSRSKEPDGLRGMQVWFEDTAFKELGHKEALLLIDNVSFACEKPAAFLTVDDRAVCFDGDFAKLDPIEMRKFKPWNRK